MSNHCDACDAEVGNRWERRAARRHSERARVKKHGASLKRVYDAAIRKRGKS